MRAPRILHLIPLTACLLAGSAASAQPLCGNGSTACRQIVLKLEPNQSIEAVAAGYGTAVLRSIPARRTFLLETASQSNLQAVLNGLSNDPRVAWAEPNFVQLVPGGNTQSFFLSMVASPQQFHEQYSIALLDLPAAQQISTGISSRIAVLDTGLDAAHPWFAGRVCSGGWNFVENTANFADVGNGLDDNSNGLIDELTGHGTMVAGVSLLVAPGAQVIPFKILNSDGVGTAFFMAQGIDAAVSAGARVINISAGSTLPSQVVADAITDALAANRVVVASVGNMNREAPPLYPAAYPGVLAVAGTNQQDVKASFSDYGTYVSLSAPAVSIIGPVPGSGYGLSDGTSFAAPFVSGTAALIASTAPTASRATITNLLTQTTTSVATLNPSFIDKLGTGRLNAGSALVATVTFASCYANCDASTVTPILNVADFTCFLQKFAAGDAYANCDASTTPPILNVADFTCFLQKFAAGCP